MDPTHEILRVSQSQTEWRQKIIKDWGWEEIGNNHLIGMEFQSGKMEKVLEAEGGDGCTKWECT